tara:strand:- start:2682 stop:3182 length:501 start_codon:yes stop_codon:yes gene_type:complete
MNLEVFRFSSGKTDTLGLMFDITDGERKFLCYTLEDEYRGYTKEQKVYGATRIPTGKYEIKYRTEGGYNQRYKNKFGSEHKGMLHVTNVPNFKYILIHIGNYADETAKDDTHGCLLVGSSQSTNYVGAGSLSKSTHAYKRLYRYITTALDKKEKVFITYTDFDKVE